VRFCPSGGCRKHIGKYVRQSCRPICVLIFHLHHEATSRPIAHAGFRRVPLMQLNQKDGYE
jgi:hypothetical protein